MKYVKAAIYILVYTPLLALFLALWILVFYYSAYVLIVFVHAMLTLK
jgi:hypothetical protein